MEKMNLFGIHLLTLLSVFGEIFSDNTCDGDWEPYKDEKCLRAFDTEFVSYEEAESYCKTKYDANLVSIGLEEKQKFVEDFLKSKGILNEVWIGLKYESDNNYVWSDNTVFHYSNWVTGSPKNDPTYCVQIYTDDVEFGKWADVLCTKKNVVLCEKVQPWSLSEIQNELMNIKQNLIPIGFMYVQLPTKKSPAEIWPWMTWEDVSADYAGVFFRVEGGNSSSFGSIQEGDSPRLISSTLTDYADTVYFENEIPADGLPHVAFFNVKSSEAWYDLFLTVSKTEVRPRNMAIRVWERTQ